MPQFRVMSWNVENLFDVGDEYGPATQAELKAKIESLRPPVANAYHFPSRARARTRARCYPSPSDRHDGRGLVTGWATRHPSQV